MATTTFTTTFDLTTSPKQFTFVDTTDWIGQGIALADVNSSFKITSPSGAVIYNNTDYTALGCDINTVVSTTNQTVIQLPLGIDGFPEVGVYTIIMTTDDSNLSVQYTKTNSYTYAYTQPTVLITQTAEVVYSPLFTSTDATNYVVNGITPVISRVHTIDYPYGSAGEGSPVVGSAAIITTSTFYNGTQTTEIESTLTYTFSDGLIIIDFISGSKEILVDGRIICTIYCCIRAVEQQWLAAPNPSPVRATLEQNFTTAMSLVGLISVAPTCGKSSDVNGYITTLQTMLNCTDDCDCSGDSPTQITGLGGLINNVVVTSSGSPITVTPVTVGNTTTYNIVFDATLLTKLNAGYNSEVVAGNNVTVTPVGPVSDIKTFTIDGVASVVTAGAGITVIPSGPVAGVTSYSVAVTGASLTYTEFISPIGAITTNIANPATYIAQVVAAVPTTGTYQVSISPSMQVLGPAGRLYVAYAIAVNGAVPLAPPAIGTADNPFVQYVDQIAGNAIAAYSAASPPPLSRTLPLIAGDLISLYALDIGSLGNSRVLGMAVTLTKIG